MYHQINHGLKDIPSLKSRNSDEIYIDLLIYENKEI